MSVFAKRPIRVSIVMLITVLAGAQQNSAQKGDKQNGPPAIIYAKGGAFLIEAPKGWTVDHETGQQHGVCCVYYPEGSTWNDAETVMYPNIATKGPGQETLKEFMAADLADFRDHNPEMTYETVDDVPLKNNRIAKVRLFYNVNRGSSEAVAYVDEDKIIAVVVISSKSRKGLNDSIPMLRSALQSYSYMDVQFASGAQEDKRRPFELPKD